MSESLQDHENIRQMQIAIEKATDIVAGPGSNPLEVFPDPSDKERRADVVWGDDLSEEQQAAFRGVMAELGPGRESNIGPEEAGVGTDYVALFEGGQAHKMIAELNIIDRAGVNPPSQYVVSGSTGRSISDAEIQSVANLLDIDPSEVANNEYVLAEQVVRMREGFVPAPISGMDSEQYCYSHIGNLNGIPVSSLGIKRIPRDGGGYNQLSNQSKIELLHEMYEREVAIVTSATYQPSNEVAATNARETTGREAHVLSYGTHELAKVKGTDPAEPPIAQLGAEAYKTAQLLSTV